jgi:hypothetical protein
MTPARLLFDLQRAGFRVSAVGNDLAIDGPLEHLDDATKAAIRRHKQKLLGYCRPSWGYALAKLLADLDADQRESLRFQFEERAGIAEYDGGMDRYAAERLAFDEVASVVAVSPIIEGTI